MADETPQEEFDHYKKELGKQYMDGLISDTEYDEMLRAKEAELGLNQPTIPDEEEGPECPSCGALIGEFDAECGICGIALEPVTISAESEAVPIPADELGLEEPEIDEVGTTCPSCGAEISEVDSVCTMCGHVLEAEAQAAAVEAEITDIIDEKPLDDEKSCPSCGAFLDAEATECIICETPIEEAVPEPEPIPVEESIPEAPAEEISCAGCGAVLDDGATECFICGVIVGEEPTPELVDDIDAELSQTITAPASDEAGEPIPEPEAAEEFACDGCGAVLEDESSECFICGPVEEPAPEEPVPEPEIAPIEEPIPEPVPEKPVEEPAISDEMDSDLLEIQEEIPEAEIVEEIILHEGEIICPSCSSVIPEKSDKCPECWTDFSLYVRCPACTLLTPSGEDSCRECFAPIELTITEEELTEVGFISEDMEMSHLDVDIPDEIEITEELKEEMTHLEIEEEQGKECLVCGAIFGPEDEVCPVCLMEYGTEIEEPERIDYDSWDKMEVEIAPTVFICPNCGENVSGLEATDREINEGRWFYRGIITIFIGVFFTSFSIWARGISAENASLGLNPAPTDVLLNVIGWITVLMGFMFWFFSWKLHEELAECSECGIEINLDMANCINCGVDLTDGEQDIEEDYPEEEHYEEPMAVEEPAEVYEEPYEEPVEDLEVPVETYEEPVEEPIIEPEPVAEIEESVPEPEPPVEAEGPGAELPTEHEEHKQCPGCGIFVDLEDAICPVCDTEFGAVETIEPESVADEDIEILSENDELAGLGIEAEPSVDDVTVPEESAEHVECPSCGADVDKGTELCPVCEYPLT